MYSTGTARKWQAAGIEWAVFFQDTNGLAFYTLPAVLGVSKLLDLQVCGGKTPWFVQEQIRCARPGEFSRDSPQSKASSRSNHKAEECSRR
jgi:hypothetical protein